MTKVEALITKVPSHFDAENGIQRTKIGDAETRNKGGFEITNYRRDVAAEYQIIYIHCNHRVLPSHRIFASVEAGFVVTADEVLFKEDFMQSIIYHNFGDWRRP